MIDVMHFSKSIVRIQSGNEVEGAFFIVIFVQTRHRKGEIANARRRSDYVNLFVFVHFYFWKKLLTPPVGHDKLPRGQWAPSALREFPLSQRT